MAVTKAQWLEVQLSDLSRSLEDLYNTAYNVERRDVAVKIDDAIGSIQDAFELLTKGE